MRRTFVLLAGVVLLAAAGCGGDGEKGIYSRRDKPVAGPAEPAEDKPAADSGRATPAEKAPPGTARDTKR